MSIITKGLIDSHIHGGYGVDFNTASTDEIIDFSIKILNHGITGFFPTIMTDSVGNLKKQLKNIEEAQKLQPKDSSRILGVHLEGPFISKEYKGIHPEKYLLQPSIEAFQELEHPLIKIVTLAPELDKDFSLIKYLKSKNIIISAGHSGASAEIIKEAQNVGLSRVCHLFNAMKGLHHREEALSLEALSNNSIFAEIIADGSHVTKKMLEIVFKLKEEVILVSDSLPLNRALSESIVFGGYEIFKKENKAVNKDGTIAGSLMFLNDIIGYLTLENIIPFEKAIYYSTVTPLNGLDIKLESQVIWDENLEILEAKIL